MLGEGRNRTGREKLTRAQPERRMPKGYEWQGWQKDEAKYADGALPPAENLGVLRVQLLSGLRFRRRRFARRTISPSRTDRESARR